VFFELWKMQYNNDELFAEVLEAINEEEENNS
jgi:hypothetical protein